MKTVTVDANALLQVLRALTGSSHLIRELQATRNLPPGPDNENPINKLIDDYNRGVSIQPDTILPAFIGIGRRKLEQLLADGWRINGFEIERNDLPGTGVQRGAITVDGMVIWWNPGSAAPAAQPLLTVEMVDAAMVEMSNIHPPLKRSECERLLRAALASRLGPPPSFRFLPADDTEGGAA